jgi:hypothetical protein
MASQSENWLPHYKGAPLRCAPGLRRAEVSRHDFAALRSRCSLRAKSSSHALLRLFSPRNNDAFGAFVYRTYGLDFILQASHTSGFACARLQCKEALSN